MNTTSAPMLRMPKIHFWSVVKPLQNLANAPYPASKMSIMP